MVSVDEHTQNAIEIVSEGAKLTEQTILFVLKNLVNFLDDSNDKEKAFISDTSKEGKQKIKDLVKKHQENVYALDENLTKEQIKDYEREFKKLGVDFSVTKNNENNYSFFFASSQSNLIEKALKNVSELKSAVLENEQVKAAENELNGLKENLPPDRAKEVKNLYDKIFDLEDRKNEILELLKNASPEEIKLYQESKKDISINPNKEELSPQEEQSSKKEISPQESQITNQENTTQDSNIKVENLISEMNNLEEKQSQLMNQLKSLSPEEAQLFEKYKNVAEVKKNVKETIIEEKSKEEVLDNKEKKVMDNKEKEVPDNKEKKVTFSLESVKQKNEEISKKERAVEKHKELSR